MIIGGIFIGRKAKFKGFSIAFGIITCLIVLQPQRPYLHYGMILIPTFIIPLASIYTYIKEKNINNNIKNYTICTSMILLLIIPTCFYIKEYKNINIIEISSTEKEELSKYIEETSEEKDSILVLGNDCEIYLLTNRKSASRYEYQSPIYKIDKNILDKVVEDIKNNKPKYIIVPEYQNGEEIKNEILDEINKDYKLIKEIGQYEIYSFNSNY